MHSYASSRSDGDALNNGGLLRTMSLVGGPLRAGSVAGENPALEAFVGSDGPSLSCGISMQSLETWYYGLVGVREKVIKEREA
jgi:hypothetical protein